MAVGGSLLSVLMSMIFLKDHRVGGGKMTRNKRACAEDKNSMQQEANQHDKLFLQSVKQTLAFLRHPRPGPLLFMKLINGKSSSAFSTILPLILTNQLRFSPSDLGYFMSLSSLSIAAFAVVGISPAMFLLGNRPDRLALWGMGCRLVTLLVFGASVSHTLSVHHSPEEEPHAVSSKKGTILASLRHALSFL